MLTNVHKSLFLLARRVAAATALTTAMATTAYAAPTTWTLQNVEMDSGDRAWGSFTYDPEPFNPPAGEYGTFSNIDITVTRGGVPFAITQVNPDSTGNSSYIAMTESRVSGDLVGAVGLVITLSGAMSDAGGTFDILPGPQNLSFTGVCGTSSCNFLEAPYYEIVGGQLTADPILVRWYLEDVRDNNGASINGSFGYSAGANTYEGVSILTTGMAPRRRGLALPLPANGFNAVADVLIGDEFVVTSGAQFSFAESLNTTANTIALQTGASAAPFFTCASSGCATITPTNRFVASGRIARYLDAPRIGAPATVQVNENSAFVFDVNATDSIDSENNNLLYSVVPGNDAAHFVINAATGELAFTIAPNFEAPDDADTDNTYRVTMRVTDYGGLTGDHTFDVVVNDVLENTAPTLSPIGDLVLTEGVPFALTINAQDTDGDDLHFALANAPSGATLNDNGDGTATFRFTPTFEQSANFSNVLFIVSDNGSPMLTHSEAVNLSVGNVNRPFVIQSVPDIVTPENTPVSFVFFIADPDGDSLGATVGLGPTGSTFSQVEDGVQFDWTPTYGQSGNYSVTLEVTDTGSPTAVSSQTVMITVGDVNRPPVLNPVGDRSISEGTSLLIDLVASDPDGQSLSYALSNAPTGLTLTDNGDGTGNLRWTPDFSQAGSFADITVTVSDGGAPTQSDQEVFTLTVGNVNRAPTLNPLTGRTIDEGEVLNIVLVATDPDGDSLSYPMPADLPPGASFVDSGDGSALFSWSPGYDQAGNYRVTFRADDDDATSASDTQVVSITVGNTNRPPVLARIGNRTAAEGAVLAIDLSASDPDGDDLAFALANAPADATLTDNGDGSATFRWTPAFDQAGNFDNVLVTVTDNASTAQSDSEAFLISVGNVNRPPQLAPIGNRTVDEGDELTFDVTASDPDGDAINYLSPTNLLVGAQFARNANGTATFRWTPGFAQSGNTTVVFEVNDSSASSQTVTEAVTITVGNVNRPPQLMPIGNRTVTVGTALMLTLTSADPDGDALSFPAPAMPDGAVLADNNDGTASFRWTPTDAQVGDVTLDFATTDGRETATESVTVTVNARAVSPPAATSSTGGGGGGSTGLGELLVMLLAVFGLRRRSPT